MCVIIKNMKKSIKNEVQNTIVIEKSEFISYLFHVESFEEGKEYINKLHKKYPDATHIVYAIVLENDARSTEYLMIQPCGQNPQGCNKNHLTSRSFHNSALRFS